LCDGVKSEAFVSTYGAVPLMRPEHVAAAQLILVWGNNVTVSQMHLMSYINAARRRGAKLVVIDPRRVPVARKADLHLAIKPGTDVYWPGPWRLSWNGAGASTTPSSRSMCSELRRSWPRHGV
jgi:anaerobic selenocysteine-containing dehydrogenase